MQLPEIIDLATSNGHPQRALSLAIKFAAGENTQDKDFEKLVKNWPIL
jgi:hypothetical protein